MEVRIFQVVVIRLLMAAQLQQDQHWAETQTLAQVHAQLLLSASALWWQVCWELALAPCMCLRCCVAWICLQPGSRVESLRLALPLTGQKPCARSLAGVLLNCGWVADNSMWLAPKFLNRPKCRSGKGTGWEHGAASSLRHQAGFEKPQPLPRKYREYYTGSL